MTLHSNARTCPRSRRLLADRVLIEGWSLAAAAEAAGVSERTAWKWVERFRREGEGGLEDRSSAPTLVPSRTPADREQLILLLEDRLKSDLGIRVTVELVSAGSLRDYTYGREGKARRLLDKSRAK